MDEGTTARNLKITNTGCP